MNRILVATDFSARSDRALDRALDLAHLHDAQLTVLHVVDENLPGALRESVVAAAEMEIVTFLEKLTRRRGISALAKIAVGRAFSEIVDAADNGASDLIVLGRHRDESCVAALGGTTMAWVVRMGRHPVLVVADRVEDAYRKIMVGVDFSAFSRRAVSAAFELAPDAEFHFVHAIDVPFQGFLQGNETRRAVTLEDDRALSRLVEEEMAALFGAPKNGHADRPRIHKISRQGDVVGVLRREVARVRPDVLVIGARGRTGAARTILGSVAEELLDRPPCDILAVKFRGERPLALMTASKWAVW